VLASQLWGTFKGDTTELTAEQELEADRKYFLGKHKLTMPIGIDTTMRVPGVRDPEKLEWAPDRIGKAFGVNAWPSFYLIDHNGIVRKRGMSSEEVEKLLAEILAPPKTAPAPR
jgi:hypothetical protein